MGSMRTLLGQQGYVASDDEDRPHIYQGGRPELFHGYIEGEYIEQDLDLPSTPFLQHITAPLRLELRKLLVPFRTSEIHIAMDINQSDSRTLELMRAMGFNEVQMPKPKEDRTSIIFTVQSESHVQIQRLAAIVERVLLETGGVSHGSIKTEPIADWILSDADVRLPPVLTEDCV